MKTYLSFLAASLLATRVSAGDKDWLSPVYKQIFQNKLPFPSEKPPKYTYTNQTTGVQIDYYEIEIKEFESQIYPGLKPAKLVGYDGMSPGPTIRVQRGRETVVRFVNKANMANSVHLHGSYSRAMFDGWAEDLTEPGQYKDYYYPNKQSARTLWYHDHAVSHTAENAYFGQAGFYILEDPAENALGLPKGAYDIPLALSSKQYNSDGTLFSPAAERDSLWGDVIHVNGQPWPYHSVEPRKYRLRFLDTSVSRAFKLTFETDDNKKIPFHVVGSDAGLLTKPVQTDNLEISMAERWEVVVDFSAYAGKNITVKNARDVQADEDYNSTDKVMRFVVGKSVSSTENNGNLPSTLRTVPMPPNKSGVDRKFKFERSNGEWQINDVTFDNVNNRILAKPPRGAVEVWEFSTGGGWSHPVHVHLVDFQVIYRKGSRDGVLPYEKEALKDVVLLGKSETVRVIARFAPWDGVYMFHCHNLIHEDHDMMAAFNVTSLADWGYPETTQLIDPMDQRFRSKTINSADFSQDAVLSRIGELYSLDAYKDPDKVEAALETYWANGGKGSTTLATSTRSASASSTGSSQTSTATTTARATTSSGRSTSTSSSRSSSTSTKR
ncbi:unnamed protein product [Periconia digitata]|uniref:Oxidase cueO n=1 Tax=Periconia digitata TaxID=1303443 RepID=A0A9W4U357_9PLEO|nr:unnamed protein product [Periconia digitata]